MAVIIGLILAVLLLRYRSVITTQQKPVFGRLVTDFTLPALIFASLARQPLARDELMAVAAMMISLLLCMTLAWVVGRALKLSSKQLGAFVLVAAFGSSSTLGYALITQVFSGEPAALAEAVIISELGVGVLIFTVGVAVAMYFGRQEGSSPSSGLKAFLTSPIFIALVLGLAVAQSNMTLTGPIWTIALKILDLIGESLPVFVALTIGLMLKIIPLRSLSYLIIAVAVIKLIVKPIISFAIAQTELLPSLDTEILLIETAMPSGTVAAVLADRYGCDGAIASALVVATYGLSLLTIPLIMLLAT
jgi:predicted permease